MWIRIIAGRIILQNLTYFVLTFCFFLIFLKLSVGISGIRQYENYVHYMIGIKIHIYIAAVGSLYVKVKIWLLLKKLENERDIPGY